MRKIYAIIFGSSLVSAAAFCLLVAWYGLASREVIAAFVLTFLAVWLSFLICLLAIRKNFTPRVFMAACTGIIEGALILLLYYYAIGNLSDLIRLADYPSHRVQPSAILVILGILLQGAMIGLLLGVINFLVWSRFEVMSLLVVRQLQGE